MSQGQSTVREVDTDGWSQPVPPSLRATGLQSYKATESTALGAHAYLTLTEKNRALWAVAGSGLIDWQEASKGPKNPRAI